MIPQEWIPGIVLQGDQSGRKLGFPTINLDPRLASKRNVKEGIYASWVRHQNEEYMGALYYGPRMVKQETQPVLEIHIIDFNETIYGEEVMFKIMKFIRGVKNFDSMSVLVQTIKYDIAQTRETLTALRS